MKKEQFTYFYNLLTNHVCYVVYYQFRKFEYFKTFVES